MLVGIPLLSYSQGSIQELPINKYQIQSVLKDRAELEYLREYKHLSDSLENLQENKISNLYQIIASNKIIQQNQVIEIDYYKSAYITEKRKNKLILLSSGIVATGLIYLYITK